MSIEDIPDSWYPIGTEQFVRHQLHEQVDRLRAENKRLKQERESYKESAESWSTRAAQEQLRAEHAEQEFGKLIAAIRMNVVFTPGETDAEGIERTCVELRELVTMYSRERNAARQSRARLVQLWDKRGIPARAWHAAERTWKP